MKSVFLIAGLLLAFSAHAGNDNSNPCGNNGNNCNQGSTNTANGGNGYGGDGGNGYGGAGGTGVGVGVGVGHGGESNAVAFGGEGGKGGQGGDGGVGLGFGGAGGDGGNVIGSGNSHNLNSVKGGDQANFGVNALDSKIVNTVGAVGSGNQTNVGGQSSATSVNVGGDTTLVERNAPPVFLGNLTATMSCAGSFNAGGSDRNGSGAFGFTWTNADCRSVVIGREFVGIGMPDVACRVFKTTKGFKRAVKADPSLANVDCTAKPTPVQTIPQAFLEARTPRG